MCKQRANMLVLKSERERSLERETGKGIKKKGPGNHQVVYTSQEIDLTNTWKQTWHTLG